MMSKTTQMLTGTKVESASLDPGENIEVSTLFGIPPRRPSPLMQELVENLGLELYGQNNVKTDEMQQTNVKGLYAAGNVHLNRPMGAFSAALTVQRQPLQLYKKDIIETSPPTADNLVPILSFKRPILVTTFAMFLRVKSSHFSFYRATIKRAPLFVPKKHTNNDARNWVNITSR
jgi:hypothetical protein